MSMLDERWSLLITFATCLPSIIRPPGAMLLLIHLLFHDYPLVTWQWKWTFWQWRCIPYWKWRIFQPAIIVYRSVKSSSNHHISTHNPSREVSQRHWHSRAKSTGGAQVICSKSNSFCTKKSPFRWGIAGGFGGSKRYDVDGSEIPNSQPPGCDSIKPL